jgi:hypothetical protein
MTLPKNLAHSFPYCEDISPDVKTGGPLPCTAGLTIGIVGDETRLYAVSANAGVWRAGANVPWSQLQRSPPRAYAIALDPNDPLHVAVGERDGDAANPGNNESGVWESDNGGKTWTYILDPRAAGCPSQAVPSLAFLQDGTLVIATSGGIFVRRPGKPLVPATIPGSLATKAVTAVAASATKVWARCSDYTLLVSTDNGDSFALPTAKALPAGIVAWGRGDDFSLAALDSFAVMVCRGDENGKGNNYSQLIIYDVASDEWIIQKRVVDDDGNAALNGTGTGGRRFLKSYSFPNGTALGHGLELFYSESQNVFRATSRSQDGTFNWVKIAAWSRGTDPQDTLFKGRVHDDIWDFHWAIDGKAAWVAGDGGVFENSLDGGGWVRKSEGMHTHHAHTITIVSTGFGKRARVAYPTSDNDAWNWDEIKGWQTPNVFGDANWTDGDAANGSLALLARTLDLPWLTGFNQKVQNGIYDQCVTNNDPAIHEQTLTRAFLQFIQTPKGEPVPPQLDAVALALLPLRYRDPQGNQQPVPGPLGDGKKSGWAIIRNLQFAANLNTNLTKYSDWSLELSLAGLPSAPTGFWVSGGHKSPVYYVSTIETGKPKMYRREAGQWLALNVANLLNGAEYGSGHVNPYDSLHLYVLTTTGVMSSVDGGKNFVPEVYLTSLLTENGKYPITAEFSGYNSGFAKSATLPVVSRANGMATLSHMAFNRDAPHDVVAASPFTGVFFQDGLGTPMDWRDLTTCLPKPCAPISAVAIDDEAIYVATEGRSILRVIGYRRPANAILGRGILHEVATVILNGIVDDSSGHFLGPHGPGPVDPWGPIMRGRSPIERDAVIAMFVLNAVSLFHDRDAANALTSLTSQLLQRNMSALSTRSGPVKQ